MGLINRPELLSLDNGCVWGGALTAVRVDCGRRELIQVACPPAQIPGCIDCALPERALGRVVFSEMQEAPGKID